MLLPESSGVVCLTQNSSQVLVTTFGGLRASAALAEPGRQPVGFPALQGPAVWQENPSTQLTHSPPGEAAVPRAGQTELEGLGDGRVAETVQKRRDLGRPECPE